MTPAIEESLLKILSEKFHIDVGLYTQDTPLDALGLDSLALMEFIFAVEDHFNVRIPEDQLDPSKIGMTFGRFASLIHNADLERKNHNF